MATDLAQKTPAVVLGGFLPPTPAWMAREPDAADRRWMSQLLVETSRMLSRLLAGAVQAERDRANSPTETAAEPNYDAGVAGLLRYVDRRKGPEQLDEIEGLKVEYKGARLDPKDPGRWRDEVVGLRQGRAP